MRLCEKQILFTAPYLFFTSLCFRRTGAAASFISVIAPFAGQVRSSLLPATGFISFHKFQQLRPLPPSCVFCQATFLRLCAGVVILWVPACSR